MFKLVIWLFFELLLSCLDLLGIVVNFGLDIIDEGGGLDGRGGLDVVRGNGLLYCVIFVFGF